MTKYFDVSAFEPISDPLISSQENQVQPTSELLCELPNTSYATSYEEDTKPVPPIWQPTEPQFTKAIAEYYGVSRKSVQQWFQKVKDACPWFSEAELRLSDDRYSPLCIELMGDYRASGLIARKWGERMAERFADRIAAAKSPATAPQTIDPDVLPPESEPGTGGDRQSPTRPLLPKGRNYLAAPEEEEAELNNLQTQELQLLGQMHQGLSRLNHASEQWNRANQLRRQRLIKQTRLEAASLAIELVGHLPRI